MHKIAIPKEAVDRVLRLRESLHVFGDIDASRTAHIVVDLQNGFMAPGQPVEIPVAREIVPSVNRISAALRSAEDVLSTSKTLSMPTPKRLDPRGTATCLVRSVGSFWQRPLPKVAMAIRCGLVLRFCLTISR
jgi:hypothetical protein